MPAEPLLLALDSGTSMVKAVAFTQDGREVASASRVNVVDLRPDGGAEQDMARTWTDAADALRELTAKIEGREVLALSVTGQGDGAWLVDADHEPVVPAWLWLDARAAPTVERLRGSGAARAAFAHTGSGLAACNMSAQLLHMDPGVVARARWSLHCKDWLFLRLTGVAAADPSEAVWAWGNYRTRTYSPEVIRALGAQRVAHLLAPVEDGLDTHRPLTQPAAERTGLPAGLPVVLAYIDVACTALGAGLYGGETTTGVSILGSTGMHLSLAADPEHVTPSQQMTGYCLPFPVPNHVMQAQSTMAASLNMDWLAGLVGQGSRLMGREAADRHDILRALDAAVVAARPGAVLYHPFISSSGERGPFLDPYARASLLGFDQTTGLAELARGVYEGMGLASRDCYMALGGVPEQVRITGGAARSAPMRAILSACLNRPVRGAATAEAGAAGAAMIAAISLGLYPDMAACARDWLGGGGEPEQPDPALAAVYEELFPLYRQGYEAMPGLWRRLHQLRHGG